MPALSPVERLILYKAWGKRCVWCRRPITFDELEIEHLVPKSLSGVELARILAEYGLVPDFDIGALPNLAASCRPCNGSKGKRPITPAPIVVSLLDRAAERAPRIIQRAASFDRRRGLSEAIALIEAIAGSPTEKESSALARLGILLQGSDQAKTALSGGSWYDPEPQRLRKTKKRLGYDGLSDRAQMLILLKQWALEAPDHALEMAASTFNGSDSIAREAFPTSVVFLAYAKELGDFLARAKFWVEYTYIAEDYSDVAHADHIMDLWITLDPSRRRIVDVMPDATRALDHVGSPSTI